jgi:hypothetical protein
MGTQRTTFEKLQRERNKKAKAAAKRQRRQEKGQGGEDEELDVTVERAEDLLPLVAQLHEDYDNKLIDLETFEERKDDLIARLARAID